MTLLRRLKAAIPEEKVQNEAWEQFSSVLDPEQVANWSSAVEAWENDPSNPNPFRPETKGL